MKRQTLCLTAGILLLLSCLFPLKLLAQPYYEGKVITIIVGYAPGGGYDRMARLLAKHLSKQIPGKPAVIVQNMPGANGIIAANHLYNISKPDGLTLGSFSRGIPLMQLGKLEGIKFDVTKFAWLGSAGSEATVLAIRSDHACKTFEDLRKAKETVMVGAVGPGDLTYDFPTLLKEFLGINLKIVLGYSSSSDVMLAIERKEVDCRAGSYSSIKPFITRGLIRPLVRGRSTAPGIEHLPVDEDSVTDKKGKTIMALRSAPDFIGRPYMAPPGTPRDALNILKNAFEKVAKDPETMEDAKKMTMDFEYVSSEESMKVVKFILEQPPEIVKEYSKYLKFQ